MILCWSAANSNWGKTILVWKFHSRYAVKRQNSPSQLMQDHISMIFCCALILPPFHRILMIISPKLLSWKSILLLCHLSRQWVSPEILILLWWFRDSGGSKFPRVKTWWNVDLKNINQCCSSSKHQLPCVPRVCQTSSSNRSNTAAQYFSREAETHASTAQSQGNHGVDKSQVHLSAWAPFRQLHTIQAKRFRVMERAWYLVQSTFKFVTIFQTFACSGWTGGVTSFLANTENIFRTAVILSVTWCLNVLGTTAFHGEGCVMENGTVPVEEMKVITITVFVAKPGLVNTCFSVTTPRDAFTWEMFVMA